MVSCLASLSLRIEPPYLVRVQPDGSTDRWPLAQVTAIRIVTVEGEPALVVDLDLCDEGGDVAVDVTHDWNRCERTNPAAVCPCGGQDAAAKDADDELDPDDMRAHCWCWHNSDPGGEDEPCCWCGQEGQDGA